MSARALTMAAGGASAPAVYVEDVFSTDLYTGTGATQTITNGIDLAGKGGMVWCKNRDDTGWDHYINDTARGAGRSLYTNSPDVEFVRNDLSAFNANGFTLGAFQSINVTGKKHVGWSFRQHEKFMKIVTWTGNGSFPRTITHGLLDVPGCIIIKKTSATDNWYVWHRSLTAGNKIQLDSTAAEDSAGGYMTSVTSTTFSAAYNDSGATYVAFVYAHNAGGFGLTGTENVVSCGSFNSGGSGTTVSLGYEPQWILWKRASGDPNNWKIYDAMRGMTADASGRGLYPNTSNAEVDDGGIAPTATGFNVTFGDAQKYIYIAIRRPMKVPTDATTVFVPTTYAGSGSSGRVFSLGMRSDLTMIVDRNRDGWNNTPYLFDRLRGGSKGLSTNSSMAEFSEDGVQEFRNTSIQLSTAGTGFNNSTYMNDGLLWNFRRAPGFMDEVCWLGTGTAHTEAHNLGVAPELIIVKSRSNDADWPTYHSAVGNTKALFINNTNTPNTNTYWNNTSPTASVFSVGTLSGVNFSGRTYAAWLFATCPGVSKVGSYTGTGATQTINCGFTGGARFVLIKRTDAASNWYLWDTARGMVSGTDPYLWLNATSAEVNVNLVYTATGGFQIVSSSVDLNANGGSYIYLAIA